VGAEGKVKKWNKGIDVERKKIEMEDAQIPAGDS